MRYGELFEAYRFRLGKNLGRIDFKLFFDNVMAQRPKLWATDNQDGNLLESDDMILRGTISADGKSVVCDAWLATHGTTVDNAGNGGTKDFWVDDQMRVHTHVSFYETEDGLVQLLKNLAERWGTRLIIKRPPEEPLRVEPHPSKPGFFYALANGYAGDIQILQSGQEMVVDTMDVRFANRGVEKALLDAAANYADEHGCAFDISYAATPEISKWIKAWKRTAPGLSAVVIEQITKDPLDAFGAEK